MEASATAAPVVAVNSHRLVIRGADAHLPSMIAAPLYLEPIRLPGSHASDYPAASRDRHSAADADADAPPSPLTALLAAGLSAADQRHRLMVLTGMLLLLGVICLAAGLALLGF